MATEAAPATTVVSIGHRPSLRQWHDRQVELRRAPGEVGRLVKGRRQRRPDARRSRCGLLAIGSTMRVSPQARGNRCRRNMASISAYSTRQTDASMNAGGRQVH